MAIKVHQNTLFKVLRKVLFNLLQDGCRIWRKQKKLLKFSLHIIEKHSDTSWFCPTECQVKRSLPFAAFSEGLDDFSDASLQLLALCCFLDKLQGPFLQFGIC